jgi:predicted RNA binding protein YcfA (HicA-like mRNA interferase family)
VLVAHIVPGILSKILQQRGWQLARIHGSHHIFTMSGRRERLVNQSTEIAR